jgi:ribonuclease P protein component
VRRTADFRAVYAARARAADERLVVYARPNGRPVTRLGVSVGRRSGGSVQRNRTKRLLREAFRQARAAWPPGLDIVVVALGRDYTFQEVDGRLRRLVPDAIRRAGPTATDFRR